MKKWNEEKEIKNSHQKKVILNVIFILVALLIGGQVFISNTISTSGDRLQMLEQRYVSLSSQNDYLKKQIAQVASLSSIQKEAEEIGLVKNESTVYLQNAVNVARK